MLIFSKAANLGYSYSFQVFCGNFWRGATQSTTIFVNWLSNTCKWCLSLKFWTILCWNVQKLLEMDEKNAKKGFFGEILMIIGGLFPPGFQVFGEKLIFSTPPGGSNPARIFTVDPPPNISTGRDSLLSRQQKKCGNFSMWAKSWLKTMCKQKNRRNFCNKSTKL